MSDKSLEAENLRLTKQVEELTARVRALEASGCRQYAPTLSELLDRLTINQIKEVKLPDHKDKYAEEIGQILTDLDSILSRNEIYFDAKMLRALIVLAQINLHIWVNESNVRLGLPGAKLELTHGLNGIRNQAKNIIQSLMGGRLDYKVDCLAADFKDWTISWGKP